MRGVVFFPTKKNVSAEEKRRRNEADLAIEPIERAPFDGRLFWLSFSHSFKRPGDTDAIFGPCSISNQDVAGGVPFDPNPKSNGR